MRHTRTFEGYFTRAEARALTYHYIPFDVPARCQRIAVSYAWRAPDGETPCTVDIGIFDIRGTEPFTGGFRGWSGSARRSFVIERDRATPGYIAGPLPSGAWNIILGLYEIPESGVHWSVSIEIDTSTFDGPSPSAPGTAMHASPIRPFARPRWLRGDLHTHSEHSDGTNSIAEIARHAKLLGLDYLAITDHNTISHHAEIDARRWPVLLVPGEEVTTYTGHANVWGLREWADFRFTTDDEIHRLLRWVDERGRSISINHPKSVGPPWRFADPGFAVREVWQAPWRWYNWESVRDWDALLAEGRRITPVGGSDSHWVPPAEPMHPHTIATPTTWLLCESRSESAILDAIRAGRTAISDAPDGPFVTLDRDAEGRLTATHRRAAGCTLVLVADGEPRHRQELERPAGVIHLPGDLRFERYLRAELRTPAGNGREDVRALSAPVYAP